MWYEKFVTFWRRRRAAPGTSTGGPAGITPKSIIARFFLSSKDFTLSTNRIHLARLIPRDGEQALSALNATGMPEAHIWAWGDRVPGCGSRRVSGRVEWTSQTLCSQRLSVVQDDNPRGHVSIGDWPAGREDRLEIAAELARLGSLIPRLQP